MTQRIEPLSGLSTRRARAVAGPARIRGVEPTLGLIDDIDIDIDLPGLERELARSSADGKPALSRQITVGVIGLGYVGLTTALALLEREIQVVGYDKSRDRLVAVAGASDRLGQEERIRLARARAKLRLVQSPQARALADVDAVLICVPTPVDEHQVPDLEPLRSACEQAVLAARPGQTIVLISTTYVGCTRDLLVRPLEARGLVVGEDVFVAFSPERVDPGNTQYPQERVPRIVGGSTPACTERASELMGQVAALIQPVSSPEAAELAKLFENTFRAVNIALANELADVSHALDLDVIEVIDAAATKPYGFMPFFPGPGVGGHCIPVDPHYLLWQLRARRVGAPLIEQAMTLIAERPGRAVQRAVEVLAEAGTPVWGARILVSGVAYKPRIADVRNSPAIEIVAGLRARGAEVEYFDPFVPQVWVGDTILRSVDQIEPVYHLVLVHTVHATEAEARLADCPLVLDLSSGRVGLSGYMTAAQLVSLQAAGNEVAGHADLPTLDSDEQAATATTAVRELRFARAESPPQSSSRAPRTTVMVYAFVFIADLLALVIGALATGERAKLAWIAGTQFALWGLASWRAWLSPHRFGSGSRVALAILTSHFVFGLLGKPFGTTTVAAMITAVLIERALMQALFARLRRQGFLQQPTLVLGTGAVATTLVDALQSHPEYGCLPVHRRGAEKATAWNVDPHDSEAIQRLIDGLQVRRVFIVGDEMQAAMVDPRCEIYIAVPNDAALARRADDHVWGIPVVRVPRAAMVSPMMRVKRVLDVVGAGIAIVIAAPLLFLCAAALKLSSRGPVLFRQTRIGYNGRPLVVTKFRTMRERGEVDLDSVDLVTAETRQRRQHEEARERETRVGRVFRATCLDELPQLFDIMRGDLSLVGPRPEMPHQVVNYSRDIAFYANRHRMPAGLTGWAQIHGLRGDTSLTERARFDNYYIDNWSLVRDLAILMLTFTAVARHAVHSFAKRSD